MTGTMIFHHPLPAGAQSSSGSGVRPAYMLRAFRDLGYVVEEVTGWSQERMQTGKRLRREAAAGRQFDFVYAESSTMPNALTDPDHLPRHPFSDAVFLRDMRRHGVPVGLFYRDIHWRFGEYRDTTTWAKRVAARAFYRLDLRTYARGVDVLFLPSLAMAQVIPGAHRFHRIEALPPGGISHAIATRPRTVGERLQVLYVGGVVPPLYDMRDVLEEVGRQSNVHLTVCCRELEAPAVGDVPENCSVVHEEGPALSTLYDRADVALAVYGPHPYRDFAIPVKIFEAAGHGVPTITNSGTAAADLVEAHGLGLCVADAAELGSVLGSLARDPERLRALRAGVAEMAPEHTWAARARQVASTLLDV